MPLHRFTLSHHTRTNGAPRASQQAAYILRQERAYNTEVQAYGWDTRKLRATYGEDLVFATWGNLPLWAANNPVTFFAAADQHERANGRIASSLIVSLPRALPQTTQVDITRDWCALAYPTHPYALAVHQTTLLDGTDYPHAHMIYSIRKTDDMVRPAAQHFARWNAAHPARGGAQKDATFDAYGLVRAQRHAWSDLVNWHLEHGHVGGYIDPRSLHSREIPRTPERQLPTYHACLAKYRGRITPDWQRKMDQRAANVVHKPLEDAKAREWWAYRKTLLGNPHTHEALLVSIQANTALELRQFQYPTRTDLALGDTPLDRQINRLNAEVREHAKYRAMGKPLTPQMRATVYRLALEVDQAERQAQPQKGISR